MSSLYTKANVDPVKLAARLALAIQTLEQVLQATQPHSAKDQELQPLLRGMQAEVDAALKAAVYEAMAQYDGGLISYEQYATETSAMMARFKAYRAAQEGKL